MASQDFATQQRALGYDVEEQQPDRVLIDYVVELGRLRGDSVRIGFQVPPDYPLQCPSGPHVSPRLFPNKSGGEHPTGGIHDSPFGLDFHYWSRPFHGWPQSTRDAKAYMAHIRNLFETV